MAAPSPTFPDPPADPSTNDVPTPTHGLQGIDTPLLPVTQVITRPGGNPTITLPLRTGAEPDVEHIWRHLADPAEFFGLVMPDRADLRAAVTGYLGAVSATAPDTAVAAAVTLVEVDGQTRVVVTGEVIRPVRSDVVRLTETDAPLPTSQPDDPHWRRMAARTTSRGEADQIQWWLTGRGHVDAIEIRSRRRGAPILGALVFDTAAGLRGIDNPEPVSVLDQMSACGLIERVERVEECPADAIRAWWISPRFETHPVLGIDGTEYPVDTAAVPPFARQP